MNQNLDTHQNTHRNRIASRSILGASVSGAVAALALGAIIAPAGSAAAAPDAPGPPVLAPFDDLAVPELNPFDFTVPLLPSAPSPEVDPAVPPLTIPVVPVFTIPDFPPITIPVVPVVTIPDFPPITIPDVPVVTIPDGPVFTIPEIDIPVFELPDDLVQPTPCTVWNPALFSSTVNELEGSDIEIRFTYDDDDVCDGSVLWSLRNADDVTEIRASGLTPLADIAGSTTDAGDDYSFGIDNDGLCDWEVWITVGVNAPATFPGSSDDCEPDDGPEDATPEDSTPEDTTPEDTTPEDSTPEDTTPEDTTPEDSTPEDTTPEDTTPEDSTPEDSTPEDSTPQDDEPVETTPITPTTPVDESPAPQSPQPTPSSSLPQTGSNSTQLMLAAGLIALGLGSAAALATRRRDDDLPDSVA